ncbi:cation:proton antiporter [Tateyamaria pelophila]|uniref:cation:proton antiporter n=1 Tax=Tateyamaria pelophila TaxID=328415 RepID=UPI001CBF127D|nr:cation:proton antiporter [Tateyamaria pelophila]
MPYEPVAIIAIFAFAYSVLAARFERSLINGAVVFMGFGVAMGPMGLGFLEINATGGDFRTIAEITLALVLFVDASQADLGVLSKSRRIPQRLILIGLPLTILLGFGIGVLVFADLSLIGVAILATILAPTDAALGKAVVTNENVPVEVREGLSFESGLNDGVCVPVFLTFLAVATLGSNEQHEYGLLIKLLVEELGIGAVVGAGLALVGAYVVRLCRGAGWTTQSWLQIPVIALAIGCFATAQALHGSGFIAAFVGGLVFGGLIRTGKHELVRPAEGVSDVFALVTWVIFGVAIVGQALHGFTWEVVVYSVSSLTVVRILPVLLSLIGIALDTPEKLFIGWFGPRGLATCVFAVMVIDSGIPGAETIVSTAVCTIFLSVLAHGISARPFAILLARNETRPKGVTQSE